MSIDYIYNVFMKLKFVWDYQKNIQNKKKHGVSFEEAASIFFNLPLNIYFDPEHSKNEERYIAVGVSSKDRILVVVHIENVTGTLIRIISARKATKREQKNFIKE